MAPTILDRRFLTLLFGAACLGVAACANADRVTGKNPGGSLVIVSEGDTTATTDTLIVGDREWLQVVGADTTATITWSVSDSSIISIVERYFYRVQLSAVRAGTATVTANYEGKTGTFQVVARDSRPSDNELDRIQITTPAKDTAAVGDSVPFGFNLWNGRGDPMFGVPFQLILSDTTLALTRNMGDEHSYWIHLTNAGVLTITVQVGDKSASAEILIRPVIVDPAPSGYEVIDLGTLGGNSARPYALNDLGHVVGSGTTASGETHAFLWKDGVMQDVTGPFAASTAETITNSGLIAGVGTTTDGARHVFRWSAGVTTDLETVGGPDDGVRVVALTTTDVVRWRESSMGRFSSAIWRNGERQTLPGLNPWSATEGEARAVAMNGHRQIVGASLMPGAAVHDVYHAFIWDNGVTRDLGVLVDYPCELHPEFNCGNAVPSDINNQGQVIGSSEDSTGRSHAVMWTNGVIRDLGFWSPVAINEAGDIAGNGESEGTGYFWRAGTLTPLGSLGGGETYVVDMNDQSWVVGTSLTAGGKPHAFVWKPGQAQPTDLGGAGNIGTVAVAVNGRGDVLGYTCTTYSRGWCYSQGPSRAILWRVKP